MVSEVKGCRDLRPLIRSRCKGVLKQDNKWKAELSCVTVPRQNLEAIGAVGANLRPFFFGGSLYFECYATMPMFADAHISSLGYLW